MLPRSVVRKSHIGLFESIPYRLLMVCCCLVSSESFRCFVVVLHRVLDDW